MADAAEPQVVASIVLGQVVRQPLHLPESVQVEAKA